MIRIKANTRSTEQALKRLRESVSDIDPALRKIGGRWKSQALLSFRAGKDPWGRKWKPLAESTRRRRRRGSSRPLLDTGRLRNSITYSVRSGTLELGSNTRYASTHQFGAKKGQYGRGRYRTRGGGFPIPWGDVPARAFLPITRAGVRLPEQWNRDMLDAIKNHIERRWG